MPELSLASSASRVVDAPRAGFRLPCRNPATNSMANGLRPVFERIADEALALQVAAAFAVSAKLLLPVGWSHR